MFQCFSVRWKNLDKEDQSMGPREEGESEEEEGGEGGREERQLHLTKMRIEREEYLAKVGAGESFLNLVDLNQILIGTRFKKNIISKTVVIMKKSSINT